MNNFVPLSDELAEYTAKALVFGIEYADNWRYGKFLQKSILAAKKTNNQER